MRFENLCREMIAIMPILVGVLDPARIAAIRELIGEIEEVRAHMKPSGVLNIYIYIYISIYIIYIYIYKLLLYVHFYAFMSRYICNLFCETVTPVPATAPNDLCVTRVISRRLPAAEDPPSDDSLDGADALKVLCHAVRPALLWICQQILVYFGCCSHQSFVWKLVHTHTHTRLSSCS
jgi:hypothetical protein